MKLLIFDTCFNKTYIVYKNNGEIIDNEVIESTEKNYHSVFLIPKIRDILKKNNILIKDLDAIGVNIGPGSFTGIRAGITIARVLAQQAEIKAVGVTSSEILSALNISSKKTAVITDARKNKVYYSEYQNGETLVAPQLREKDEIFDISTEDYFIISDSSIGNLLKEHGILSLNYEANDKNLGMYLAAAAEKKLKESKEDFHWAKLKPLYIQPPSITKPKENKNV